MKKYNYRIALSRECVCVCVYARNYVFVFNLIHFRGKDTTERITFKEEEKNWKIIFHTFLIRNISNKL